MGGGGSDCDGATRFYRSLDLVGLGAGAAAGGYRFSQRARTETSVRSRFTQSTSSREPCPMRARLSCVMVGMSKRHRLCSCDLKLASCMGGPDVDRRPMTTVNG